MNRKGSYTLLLAVSVAYSLIYLLFFHKLIPYFNAIMPSTGDSADIIQVYWNTWHFSTKVLQCENPFLTDYLFYPNQTSLGMHAYAPIYGIINLFVHNPVLAINTGVYLQFLAGSIFAWQLASRFINNKLLSFIAGMFFMFNMYIILKSTVHYNLVLIALSPLIIRFFIESVAVSHMKIRIISKQKLAGFFLLILLNFIFDYYALFYAFSFILLYVLYFSCIAEFFKRTDYKKILGVLALLIAGHICIRLLRVYGIDEKGAVWSAGGTLSFFLAPGSIHYPSFLSLSPLIEFKLEEQPVYIGLVILLSFMIALFFGYQKIRHNITLQFLLFSIVIYTMIISPVFKTGNNELFYFPTALIHYIPFINHIRVPSRFIEMLFFLMPLFSLMIIDQSVRISSTRKYAFALLFALLFLIECRYRLHFSPFITEEAITHAKNNDYQQSSAYLRYNHVLKNTDDHFILKHHDSHKAILSIPFGIRDGFSQFGHFDPAVYTDQVRNHLKNVSGYLSRVSEEKWVIYKSDPFYISLVEAQQDKEWTVLSESEIRRYFSLNNVGSIVVHNTYLQKHPQMKVFLHTYFPGNKFSYRSNENITVIAL